VLRRSSCGSFTRGSCFDGGKAVLFRYLTAHEHIAVQRQNANLVEGVSVSFIGAMAATHIYNVRSMASAKPRNDDWHQLRPRKLVFRCRIAAEEAIWTYAEAVAAKDNGST
jgi:hypothetical protein